MKKLSIILTVLCVGILAGCTSFGPGKRVKQERDSLRVAAQQRDSVLEVLATSLDSIRIQEGILTVRKDENGKPLKRDQIRQNLKILSDIIQRQKERIEELESKLTDEGKTTAYYKTLVSQLRKDIAAKDEEIIRMTRELGQKNETIAQLNTEVSTLKNDVADMSAKTKEQEKKIDEHAKTISAQTVKMNTAYVMIGTKKELKKAGLLKNISGGKLDPEGVDLSQFKQMDLRKVQEFKIDSYKPKILTTHPKSSYELTMDEDSDDDISYLKIKDPSSFWSMSNFLIIQL